MIVKFIVINNEIYFGKIPYIDDAHVDIVRTYVRERKPDHMPKIEGGGLADLDAKQIFGHSVAFGRYDAYKVKELLPDWNVKPSGFLE